MGTGIITGGPVYVLALSTGVLKRDLKKNIRVVITELLNIGERSETAFVELWNWSDQFPFVFNINQRTITPHSSEKVIELLSVGSFPLPERYEVRVFLTSRRLVIANVFGSSPGAIGRSTLGNIVLFKDLVELKNARPTVIRQN